MSRHEDELPPPIDGGKVPQTIVHYTGVRRGAMAYAGRATGRRYPFDAVECCRYVPDEDLALFRAHKDFDVFDGDDSHIDPALERAKAEREMLKDELRTELGEMLLAGTPHTNPTPRPGNSGRKRGSGFGALLDCLVTCGRLDDQYGSVGAAYDAIAARAKDMPAWRGRLPARERFASVRSDAARQRRASGACAWNRHPEPWPG